MTSPLQHIEVNGARLAYTVHGSGRPLVFVHGYALRSTGPIYRALFEQLAPNFTIYALDLRGHGGSAAVVEGFSNAALADDVAAFAGRLGLRGAFYAGHSIGGFTGLLTEARHPGTFSALCLLATAAASGGRNNPEGIADIFVGQGQDRKAMHDTFAPMYVRPDNAEIALAAEATGVIDRRIHEAFFPSFATLEITGRLSDIGIPVLLLNGARDVVVPPDEQHATAKGLPFSKEVVYAGEGHMLPIEAPAMTAREIRNFCLNDVVEWSVLDRPEAL